MSKPFKYHIPTLIELIESKPCIWDKTLESFKDRPLKQKAWNEICVTLEKDFYKMDKKERRRVGEQILGKWHNVRDAFVKSLKKQYNHPGVRKYIYYDRLQFLIKVIKIDDDESNSSHGDKSQAEEEESEAVGRFDEVCNPIKRPRLQDGIDQDILTALRTTKTTPDEDEAFFMSITPSVRKMSEENKLEFRMGVLQLIKSINSREKDLSDSAFFSSGNSSSSHPTSSYRHYHEANSGSEDFTEETHLFKCE